ncbi:MAG: 2-C-methyl-D-erythritol 2,4-cyclodiphosphate synthase [Clostridia bacterium]|nr:2-C-methyl-D-erythritol 2,4-cyclodiphosphate synthase [Clostridia bacterium]
MRIGHGYDVHKLVAGRDLILCGEKIPYEKGLLGHSDADVALHALMDSMLGALALGDIGAHFPDTDPAYKDSDSGKLLEQVNLICNQKGYMLSNADLTIIAQRPKLKEYIPAMRQNIATILNVPLDCISVKATTEEKLGFTGSGEGISAHCVCLMKQK